MRYARWDMIYEGEGARLDLQGVLHLHRGSSLIEERLGCAKQGYIEGATNGLLDDIYYLSK